MTVSKLFKHTYLKTSSKAVNTIQHQLKPSTDKYSNSVSTEVPNLPTKIYWTNRVTLQKPIKRTYTGHKTIKAIKCPTYTEHHSYGQLHKTTSHKDRRLKKHLKNSTSIKSPNKAYN